MGRIVLEGGAEFGGAMSEPDRKAIELAGGPDALVVILPTAAAPDNNHERAGNNGKTWFTSLGARNVQVVPVIDRASANSAAHVKTFEQAKLVYLLGGFTHYLGQTLKQSRVWDAILQAYSDGAVVVGSSAGAMVLCEHYFHPGGQSIKSGLNLVPNACVLPHHDTFGARWSQQVRRLLPDAVLLGIDERTGMIDDGTAQQWRVSGGSGVTLYRSGVVASQDAEFFGAGAHFGLPGRTH